MIRIKANQCKNVSLCKYGKSYTSQHVRDLFTATMQPFGIAKENVLGLVVDFASNVTKAVQRLNEDEPEAEPNTSQDEAADECENYDGIENTCAMRVNIHDMRYAVQTLQLAIKGSLKLPHCDKLLMKTCRIVFKHRSLNVFPCWKNEKKTANT